MIDTLKMSPSMISIFNVLFNKVLKFTSDIKWLFATTCYLSEENLRVHQMKQLKC